MITPDGWIDWAIRLEPTNRHTNPGVNPVRGIVMHSAEGYASVLLDPNSEYGYNGNHSWHLSNLMDGRLIQHYPLTARCWHATALNNSYVGVENEGYAPKEPSLNDAQIANARRFISDIAEWAQWNPRRPAYDGDTSHTLWEHNEVVLLGGSATSCPSGRIPWDKILEVSDLADLDGTGDYKIVAEDGCIVFYVQGIPVLKIGDEQKQYPGRIAKNFGGDFMYLSNPGDGLAHWSGKPTD